VALSDVQSGESNRFACSEGRLLFQGFFEEMNVINPDGTFAIDDDIQSGLFGALSWL
jgi:hypothetical protein